MDSIFSRICNIAYVLYVKVINNKELEKLVFAAVKNQQGKNWNYVCIINDPLFNGVYRYKASLTKKFNTGTNKGLECYMIPFETLEFMKPLEDIDPSTSLGRFILKRIEKMRRKYVVDKR